MSTKSDTGHRSGRVIDVTGDNGSAGAIPCNSCRLQRQPIIIGDSKWLGLPTTTRVGASPNPYYC